MKKLYTYSIIIGLLLIGAGIASAMSIPAAQQARNHSPVITQDGELMRVDFIHYARGGNPARPENPENNKKPKGGDACYKLMGVKWKQTNMPYYVNPTNSGLDANFVSSTFNTSINTWDDATGYDLFGAGSVNTGLSYGDQDYNNTIAFGLYNDPGVIAVTSTWYMRRGKEIVEFDMLYNTAFNWGDAKVDPTLMDLENIATHELGHGIGLLDIYTDSCSSVTMFGYGTEGEVDKRSLETADIEGLQIMYGI